MKTSHVEAALEEMEFEMVDNNAGLTLPCSKPASFSFTEPAELDESELEVALEKKGFFVITPWVKRQDDGPRFLWDGEVYIEERYAKISVKIWRDSVRIYPQEDGVELGELAKLTNAIETALNAPLEHDPIEQ